MKMEGSSDTGWRKSASSRGLDTSASSERNLRLLHESRRSLSTDASRNSVLVAMDPVVHSIEWGDVSLRRWLDNPERSIDAIESLHIFRQIVEIVSTAHSQGIVVNNVRPSCFIMSSFNHVSFIESASCSDSGSDSLEDGLDGQDTESKQPCSSLCNDDLNEQRSGSSYRESQLIPDTIGSKSQTIQATNPFSVEEKGWCETKDTKGYRKAGEKRSFPMKELLLMESGWYTSPEEIAGAPCSCASDIYRLGVLLFELFCTFSSIEEKSGTMSSLRHRVLPPQLLLKWPKEASFCLWLLHPDPCSRPKMGDLLQSEFLNEPRDNLNEREAAIELREKIEEHELLLEFLVRMRQAKQDAASKLQNTVSFLSSDIEEIVNKQKALKEKGGTFSGSERIRQSAPDLIPIKSVEHDATDHNRQEIQIHDAVKFSSVESESHNQENLLSKNSRLIQNFKKLESAYLSTRHRPARLSGKPVGGHSQLSSNSRGSVVSSVSLAKEQRSNNGESGWISPFLEGLCKYLSFTKLNVKADLKQGDLLNSSNLVCSVGFDRDGEFFATAGVNKKIKVFECDAILNGNRDIHYPVTEMACRSKLSSICWNSYIKSQIASSNFEGVVQVWDAARSQVFVELKEHERRVWSVDFSSADPTLLASGSDDGSVKLWSINQGASIGTIKTKANVCCVQFPIDSGRSLAFGSADHKIYYYDLRSPRVPLCTLIGHNKTVSYIKFVDSNTLVSASTDNTLKLWDLSLCASRVVEGPLQSFTGHTNMKNFVGLSVSDGYIATGSETNEVFIYHKAFPMPALSYKFSSLDPLSGNETEDAAQFISSVCWRGQSSTLVAANSTGDVKLLEMV
ncbi:protein SPA1-RELATED 3-like isoform X1 [Chenopodium quinoa]|uniref:protein SPA1-RELATED 3-like isoform X1 n=2 Tax=Chenopodium quinoa TaxID=63459 RepID=UPI000B781C2E|nr:protein SPA1-RELATED 3-like isoform X1 [Chenopodium quinoa]